MAAAMAPPASFRPVTWSQVNGREHLLAAPLERCTASRSTPGKSPSVISTTVTRLPKAA